MRFFRRWRKHIGVLCLLLVVIMIIIVTTNGKGLQNKSVTVFDRVTYPVQRIFSGFNNLYDNVINLFRGKKALLLENESLKDEIIDLKKLESEIAELQRENSSFRQLLDYTQKKADKTYEVAEIIYRDPNDWYRQVVINVGENDGIQAGMTVVAVQEYQVGLLGIVDEVYAHTSRVQLIVDPMKSIATAAQVQGYGEALEAEPVWYQGIVEGSYLHQGKLEMFYITHEANIDRNAPVITTGLGGHYVADIPIGYVEEIELDGYGLLKRAIIKPHIDFNRLKEILIITGSNVFTDERGEDQ